MLSSGRPGAWVHFTGLHLDHILPEFMGGTAEPENLQLLCPTCNRRKGWRG
jgi:5-methylcytosine-specific restriction endonuclease McrA